MDRRQFIGSTLAASAAGTLLGALHSHAAETKPAAPASAPEIKRKIKIGLIGCGGRGHWLMPHFQKHGGFELHTVADYFQPVADQCGDKFGVDKSRRFSGLSGYQRLIESGVEAVLIEDVPYFYPEQAKAAVEAGKHVYVAKPVAVDVPGTLLIGEAGKLATKKNLCFLVDYQLPTDPACIEVANRIRDGALGPLGHIASFGMAWHAWPDPALGPDVSSRFRNEIWLSDTALSGDTIVSYDIHIIDGIVWVLGKPPVAASGCSRTYRPNPHGDRTDVASVVYECADGTIWTHVTQALDNSFEVTTLSASFYGLKATGHLQYGGKVYVRGGDKHYSGQMGGVFEEGVVRNVASFYRNITEGHFENASVQRAVDGHLAAILGREAAARKTRLTMDELIKENKRLEVDLKGLKA
jgi:myo-inositol 2-dehydrogenase / D-chiro-inositol 1-dehydrogenase